MKRSHQENPIKLIYGLCSLVLCLCQASDSLEPGQELHNNEILVSAGGVFELGFFSSTELTNHYLGIWFRIDEEKKPVWVWHRDYPLIDSSCVLKIRPDGNMEISDRRNDPILVNQGSVAKSNNTIATLLDSGNLILKEGETIIWQSFDYPTDTFFPGMRLGLFELGTNDTRKKYLSSWSTPSIPSRGHFSLGVNPSNVSEFSLWAKGKYQKIGFWDGEKFSLVFQSSADRYNFSFVSTPKEVYLVFNNNGISTSTWFVLASSVSSADLFDCITQIGIQCEDGDDFLEVKGSRPSSMVTDGSRDMSIGDCELFCRGNCSCVAFSSLEDDGIECQLYYGDKNDIRKFMGQGNVSIYVRGSAPETDEVRMKKLWWLIVTGLIYLLLMILLGLYVFRRAKLNNKGRHKNPGDVRDSAGFLSFPMFSDAITGNDGRSDHDLVLLNFSSVARSTNNFSDDHKIGKGGFGTVYIGKLSSGQEIAVKRLSSSSGQGLEEFKTELQLISKLQHVNLVKLLGCCVEHNEKILIYEYMPNKSLDSFIFGDPEKRRLMNWGQRFRIIEGIAQGLLYLHKYSRLRIIHRDLKTSNILLDSQLNPKISDFGMARILFNEESRTKTNKVVGTYGYMSPEYGVHGLFSTKSDVYSFGVIILEIVSGRPNLSFDGSESSSTLLGYAWELWRSGRSKELMDPMLEESHKIEEFMQCVQLGLLCIQDNPEDRPSMSDIVSILSNESHNLATPKQPTFSTQFTPISPHSHSHSLNYVTFSALEAR